MQLIVNIHHIFVFSPLWVFIRFFFLYIIIMIIIIIKKLQNNGYFVPKKNPLLENPLKNLRCEKTKKTTHLSIYDLQPRNKNVV